MHKTAPWTARTFSLLVFCHACLTIRFIGGVASNTEGTTTTRTTRTSTTTTTSNTATTVTTVTTRTKFVRTTTTKTSTTRTSTTKTKTATTKTTTSKTTTSRTSTTKTYTTYTKATTAPVHVPATTAEDNALQLCANEDNQDICYGANGEAGLDSIFKTVGNCSTPPTGDLLQASCPHMCGLCRLASASANNSSVGTPLTTTMGTTATVDNVAATAEPSATAAPASGDGDGGESGEGGSSNGAASSTDATLAAKHAPNVEFILLTSVLGVVLILNQVALLCTPRKEVRYYFN